MSDSASPSSDLPTSSASSSDPGSTSSPASSSDSSSPSPSPSSTPSTSPATSPPLSSPTPSSSPSSTPSSSPSSNLPSSSDASQSDPGSSIPSSASSTPSSTTNSASSESTLTQPVTTIVQTTLVSTSDDGQAFTTVFSTQSIVPAGATVTPDSSSSTTSHSSHTGAIVGGVVGGIAGLLLLIAAALLYLRRRRRLSDEAFDGNFDPDRIVRPASGAGHLGGRGAGPTLPNIPVSNSDPELGSPQMAEMDDDGMGGRLNASAVGGGIINPYPLYQSTSPTRGPGDAPPSARSWGNSSDAHHSMYSGHIPDFRGPSPGPSIPTQYTGGSGSGSFNPYTGQNMAQLPPGAAPGLGAPGVPSSAYAYGAAAVAGSHQARRMSTGTTASSGDRHNLNAGLQGPGSGSGSSAGHSVQSGSRFLVANPDEGRYAGGVSEDARRAYIAAGPSGKSPTGPSQPDPREVLVHRDGGRVESNQTTPESEGPDEIPPTYDSLLGAAGMGGSDSKSQSRR